MIKQTLRKYIEYVVISKDDTLEMEVRFGKYGRVSSNISEDTFNHILLYLTRNLNSSLSTGSLLTSSSIRNSLITDYIYNDTDIKKRVETNKESNTVYIKKTKIYKEKAVYHNLKIDLSKENIITDKNIIMDIEKKHKLIATRHKKRTSIINGCWVFDLSIMTHTVGSKSNVFYEVEMELINKKDTETAYKESVINITNILNIINCSCSSIEQEILSNIHNSVVTLERSKISYLVNSHYYVCDKADGTRKLIYHDKTTMFSINPTEDIVEKINIDKFKSVEFLLDGELVNDIFYAFDILFYNEDIRNLNLIERLKYLKKCISNIKTKKIQFKMKKFHETTETSKLWKSKDKFPYELDGLIFTPVYSSYIGYLPIIKWKEKHSIDVKLRYNSQYNFTEFLTYNDNIIRTSNPRYRGKMVNNNGILGVSGKLTYITSAIYEFEYYNDKWNLLRQREDKDKPNAPKTILGVLNAINENITVTDLDIVCNISTYEKMSKNIKCYSSSGFNFVESSPVLNKYYTNITKKLIEMGVEQIKNYNKKPAIDILIINCNKQILCGFYSFFSNVSKKININIIDSRCMEVYGQIKSEGYVGLIEFYENLPTIKNLNVKISWNTKPNTKVDLIYQDDCNEKHNTVVIGLKIDKDSIEKELNDKCILLYDEVMNPFYRIIKDSNKDSSIKIKRTINNFFTDTIVFNDSFKHSNNYYPIYDLDDSLTDYDLLISKITFYYIDKN